MEDFIFEHPLVGGLIAIVGFVFILGFIVNLMSAKSCMESYKEYNPQYSFWTDCRVEWQGKLTPVYIVKKVDVNP